jgi:excinuclease UvrABC nuclease subunit
MNPKNNNAMNFQDLMEGRIIRPWVRELSGKSGVYIIREKGLWGGIVYIGESHTGRLNTTMLRHFQHWTGKTKGPTFARTKVEIAVITTRKDKAVKLQDSLIAEHKPALNVAGKPGFWDWLKR